MSAIQPFAPHPKSTQIATLVANTAQALTFDKTNHQVRVVNLTSAVVHVRAYSANNTPVPVADVTEYPVPPNGVSIFTKGQGQDSVSLFSTGAGTVYVSTGDGW